MQLPRAIRDGAPDAGGGRVIINRIGGRDEGELAPAELDELTYLLESGSDGIGMLDFQASATDYVPRQRQNATLAELMESAERVEQGVPITPEIEQEMQHGRSLGGARRKALSDAGAQKTTTGRASCRERRGRDERRWGDGGTVK